MSDSILLRTPDRLVREQLESACRELNVELQTTVTLAEAFQSLEVRYPGVFVLDVERPDATDLETLGHIRERWPRLCILLVADRASSELVIEAMKRGTIDYLIKPLQKHALLDQLRQALHISRDMTVPTVYEEDPPDTPVARIIGQSAAMHEVFKRIGLVAPRDVNVLITGESGTGKDLIAKALYHHSHRRERPFLAVNCAAIPETLLESELFGHEKGAFTGADIRRIGKFEQCDGGILFLDEIGDLPLATQAKLLRVLQDGSFQRLGGMQTIRCDVRILAATNQALETLIEKRRFREDLYYRLNVARIHVPPLRDREVDVVLLAHYFVRRYNAQMQTQIRRFAPAVLPILLNYPWPGNVRELENVMKAALVVGRGTVFRPEFLPEHIRSEARGPAVEPAQGPASDGGGSTEPLGRFARHLLGRTELRGELHQRMVRAAEREIIRVCLETSGGRLAPAAVMLGITRATLRRKMGDLGLSVSAQVSERSATDLGDV